MQWVYIYLALLGDVWLYSSHRVQDISILSCRLLDLLDLLSAV